jgi:signal transduction histidine kinase
VTSQALQVGLPTSGTDELSSVLRDYMEVTQRLQKTHETLQREVVRLREEIASKDRELERRRRLSSLGELAAGVAHEVRNPLGAIQLYSGLLRRQLRDPGPARELIDKIDAGIRAIECVVQDTLALAPRSGQLEPRALRLMIEKAADVCRPTLDNAGVALCLELSDSDASVPAEPAALQRVFVNLIANAAQASPPRTTVTVQVENEGGEHVAVHVLDEGPGLSDTIIDKVFDPFFTTKENGTGLGLTVAHRLVEAHGGNLIARNRLEGGAEFVVVLPAAGGTDAAQPAREHLGRTSAA